MSEAVGARVARSFLGELRAARSESDQKKIADLLSEIALAAPELQGAACEIVRGDDDDGADLREGWAQSFFILPKAQPREEPKGGDTTGVSVGGQAP